MINYHYLLIQVIYKIILCRTSLKIVHTSKIHKNWSNWYFYFRYAKTLFLRWGIFFIKGKIKLVQFFLGKWCCTRTNHKSSLKKIDLHSKNVYKHAAALDIFCGPHHYKWQLRSECQYRYLQPIANLNGCRRFLYLQYPQCTTA